MYWKNEFCSKILSRLRIPARGKREETFKYLNLAINQRDDITPCFMMLPPRGKPGKVINPIKLDLMAASRSVFISSSVEDIISA